MRWIKRGLPHVTAILSLMTMTFFCIDRVNTAMAFMTSELSKWVFMLLAVSALLTSVELIARAWHDDTRAARRHARTRAAQSRAAEPDEEFETD